MYECVVHLSEELSLVQGGAVAIPLTLDSKPSAFPSGGAGISSMLESCMGDHDRHVQQPSEQCGCQVLEDRVTFDDDICANPEYLDLLASAMIEEALHSCIDFG